MITLTVNGAALTLDAQPEGAWAPFERSGLRRAFFRRGS
jgi:hypothetical protein